MNALGTNPKNIQEYVVTNVLKHLQNCVFIKLEGFILNTDSITTINTTPNKFSIKSLHCIHCILIDKDKDKDTLLKLIKDQRFIKFNTYTWLNPSKLCFIEKKLYASQQYFSIDCKFIGNSSLQKHFETKQEAKHFFTQIQNKLIHK